MPAATSATAISTISVMRFRGSSVMVVTASRARLVKFSSCLGAQVAGLSSTGRSSCRDSLDVPARSLSWLACGSGNWDGVSGDGSGLAGGAATAGSAVVAGSGVGVGMGVSVGGMSVGTNVGVGVGSLP